MRRILFSLLIAAAAGCATVDRIPIADRAVESQQLSQSIGRLSSSWERAATAPAPAVTMLDIEPSQAGILGSGLEGYTRIDWLPYKNAQAPPIVALSTTQHVRPHWVFSNNTPLSFSLAGQASLVPEITLGSAATSLTRATTSAVTDFSGTVIQVPAGASVQAGSRVVQNKIVGGSENLLAAGWSTNGTGSASDATTIVFGAPVAGYINAIGTLGNSHVWTVRFNIKGTAGKKVNILLFDAGTGAKGGGIQVVLTASYVTYSFTVTLGAASEAYQLLVSTTTFFGLGAADGNQTFNWTNIQAEDVTGQANQNPGPYVSVGVAGGILSHGQYPTNGPDGFQYFNYLNGNTVASNVVTEATGAHIDSSQAAAAGGVTAKVVDAVGPIGVVTEGQAQNLLLWSRDMTNVAWTLGATMTRALTSTGVDGTANSATRLTAGAVTVTNIITQLITAAATSRTYSAYIKRITGTGPVRLSEDNFTGGTDISGSLVSGTWVKVQFTASILNAVVGIKIDTNTDAIDVDMNQFEAGAIASSSIPTTTVAITRNATIDQYSAPSNTNATAMAIKMQVTPMAALGASLAYHWSSYVDANNWTTVYSDGTWLYADKFIGGAHHYTIVAWTRTVGVAANIAARFDGVNGVDVWLNGTKGAQQINSLAASQLGANFQVGADGNGANQDFSAHRNLRIYPKSLNDARMAIASIDDDWLEWLDLPEWTRLAANDEQYRLMANRRF